MYRLQLLPVLLVIYCRLPFIVAFPWVSSEPLSLGKSVHLSASNISPSDLLQTGAKRSALYQLALTELQELEAEPLCHRVAARLLVNNCQLLEGKDDTTVLTDGGRRARDFVDSYAASLAICDLERASFSIPRECESFREPTLSQIPLSDTAQLHVPEAQIRACLAGLGESPSAWNTWVSYSHKAVRFCEAARADHEKTQNILVFQKLTRVMAKLTDDVEAELQKRTEAWDITAQHTAARLSHILLIADSLWQRMSDVESLLDHSIGSALSQTTRFAEEGAQSVETLQQLLVVMMKTVLEGNSEIAFAHERSIERVSQRTSSELDIIASAMHGVFLSAMSLQKEIDLSHIQATDLAARQAALEHGMLQLSQITQTFISDFSDHARLLAQASNLTTEMLDTLEATAAATSVIQSSFRSYGELGSWWPYIVCPVVSLVMGSYGLPPSILRNIGLFSLGELVGVLVSSYGRLSKVASVFFTISGMANNATGVAN